MLTVNRLKTVGGFQDLRDEWNSLAESVRPRTPFNFPAWHELWWKHFHKNLSFGEGEFLAVALRDESGGLVAVAPLMRVARPSLRLPLIREIQFFGADPNMTEIRGV